MTGSEALLKQPSSPAEIFSYAKDRMEEIPPWRVLILIQPGEVLNKYDLLDRVREKISSCILESELFQIVIYLKHHYGLEFMPLHNGNYQVWHSDRSASLYPEYLTSIFHPEIFLEKVNFPGTGHKKNDECGEIKGWKACSNNPTHYRRPWVHSCNRKECPVCYTTWINQAVNKRVLPRMEGFEDALKKEHLKKWGKHKKVWPARHFSLSPPDSEIEKLIQNAIEAVKRAGKENYMDENLPAFFLEELIQRSYVALKKTGLKGAVVIPHFYRIKDEYKDYAVRLAEELNSKLEEWKPKYNRYTALATLENYHQYLYLSPHVHVVAYGKAVNSDIFEKELMPGWIYKNHSSGKKNKNPGYGGIVYYALTHSPVIPNKQIIRYWGCLAPKSLKCIKTESYLEEETCPDCGSPVCPVTFENLEGEGKALEIDKDHPVLKKHIEKEFVIVGLPPPI
ncbi:MAG: hypothetical protein M0R03_20830 [Novosphingobium sp.]|nr:hypothetical protein [Novosphingobium sp.]